MSNGSNAWLACGIAGTSLDAGERAFLESLRPGGVVLFARNIGNAGEVRELVSELASLPSRPYVAIDLEGGRVNRLERLVGPLPSAADAAAAGDEALAALGTALGAACASLGIGVDFAPVLDVARPGGWLAHERRCLSASAAEVGGRAAVVLAAIESFGVATCLKHYPGLGGGAVDSHRELPLLDDGAGEDAEVFHGLCAASRAVMVAHALAPSLGEAFAPASLSRLIVSGLSVRPCGPIIADDLEMGALERFGSIPERACAALLAGCDQVLVCNALAMRAEVVEHVRAWAARDPGLRAAVSRSEARVAGYGRGALADVTWPQALEAAERARELAGERS